MIPETLRHQIMDIIHTGHEGETYYILLARESIFWPVITKNIGDKIKACVTCNEYQPVQSKLELMQPDLPTHTWKTIGTDIYELNREINVSADSRLLLKIPHHKITIRYIVQHNQQTFHTYLQNMGCQ